MDDDLEDAVNWAVDKGFADSERLAIMGGSYGGFAVLSALTKNPERFACGVDIVGPANLETLIAAIPPWWETEKAFLYKAIGSPDTSEGVAMLRERSPISRADRLKKPLLIGQGANDPRVRKEEADQIAQALRDNGVTPNYILFPDEGHGFARPPNAIAFQTVTEAFFAAHLGGRCQEPDLSETSSTSLRMVDGEPWLRDLCDRMHR